jgi:nitrogen regulatory protein PII-like uncharacterized protein
MINLGKYKLSQLLRNPAIIHLIQDNLQAIKEGGVLGEAYRNGATNNLNQCIKQIISDYRDNPKLVTEIVGINTLEMIEEFTGETLADDLKGIFERGVGMGDN